MTSTQWRFSVIIVADINVVTYLVSALLIIMQTCCNAVIKCDTCMAEILSVLKNLSIAWLPYLFSVVYLHKIATLVVSSLHGAKLVTPGCAVTTWASC